jgi:acyl dehydratase
MAQTLVTADFDLSRVGAWTPETESRETESRVTRASIAAYSAATGEVDERLLSGELAPLVYGVVPSWHEVANVFRIVAPPEHWGTVVHGEHIIRSPRPLRDGDVLRTRSRVVLVKPVSTGTVVTAEAESRDAAGTLVVRQLSTGFFRGVQATKGAGEAPATGAKPSASSPEGASAFVDLPTETDPGLPARYADASGDRSVIHLDADAARAVGLPGVIIHGMCLLALAGRSVVSARAGGDPTRLRALSCRFSDVAFPGRTLTTRVEMGGDEAGFTMRDDADRSILTSGRAEIGPPRD